MTAATLLCNISNQKIRLAYRIHTLRHPHGMHNAGALPTWIPMRTCCRMWPRVTCNGRSVRCPLSRQNWPKMVAWARCNGPKTVLHVGSSRPQIYSLDLSVIDFNHLCFSLQLTEQSVQWQSEYKQPCAGSQDPEQQPQWTEKGYDIVITSATTSAGGHWVLWYLLLCSGWTHTRLQDHFEERLGEVSQWTDNGHHGTLRSGQEHTNEHPCRLQVSLDL